MDEDNETTENFELLLQKPDNNNYSRLYSIFKSKNSPNLDKKCNITTEDVISTVAKQIKMLQSSESVKSDKKPTLNRYTSKQSSFVPVNMLPRVDEPLPQKPKFDAQQCTDTQLINVIEDAENALDMNCGMTQEFETSFFQKCGSESCDAPETPASHFKFPVLDISLKGPDLNNSLILNRSPKHSLKLNDMKTNEKQIEIDKQAFDEEENSEIKNCLGASKHSHDNGILEIDSQFENCTEVINECIEIEDRDQTDDLPQRGSPILSVKCRRNKPVSSPLTFDLETFENFENIAQPIIKDTPEVEVAKQMINSQIFGKELHLHIDSEPFFGDMEKISPILELNNEVFKIDKAELANNANFHVELVTESKNSDKSDKSSDKFLKDEILFSSDEDIDYEHKSYQDLPFTCALETSFYNQIDILERTMYVGFQTANNKSIQINTDSFSKAKSLFDDIEENLNNDPTISQLVKICDNNFGVTSEKKFSDNVICDTQVSEDNNNKMNTESEDLNYNKKIQEHCNENTKDDNAINTNLNTSEYKLSEIEMCTDNFDNNFILEPVNKQKITLDVDMTDNIRGSDDIIDTPTSLKHEKSTVFNMMTDADTETRITHEETYNLKIPENKFEGFKTASNKNIKFSDQAMAKSKIMFQDIFGEDLYNNSVRNREIKTSNFHETDSKTGLIEDVEMFDMEKIDEEIIREFEDDILQSQFKEQVDVLDSSFSGNTNTKNKEVSEDITDSKNFENDDTTSIYDENIKTIDIKTHQNIGFKTASNKNIGITEKGLSIIKNVFKDIDFRSDFDIGSDTHNDDVNLVNDGNSYINEDFGIVLTNIDPPTNSKALVGFRTANNKEIKISEKAIERSKHILQDIGTNFTIEIAKEIYTKEILIGGRKTDRDQNILDKSGDCEIEEIKSNDFDEKSSDIEPPFYGFENTEDDYLFEEILVKSEKIFEQLGEPVKNNTLDSCESVKDINNEIKSQVFAGFQTANNKPVKISAEALAKTKNIFKDIDSFNEENESNQNNETQSDFGKFVGFKTASNKTVQISEDALLKSRNMFKDIDVDDNKDITETAFVGFKTANNKKIDVSKEALSKSRKILQEFSSQLTSNKVSEEIFPKVQFDEVNITTKGQHYSKFIGFQTANNKEVNISTEALAKTRQLFKEFDVETDILDKRNQFIGFQTASNKEVKISEDALAKTRKLFHDFDAETKKSENNELKFGFQTANNKELNLSAEALAKSREMFKDYGIDTRNSNQNNFKGFQTANNEQVKISEVALAKSKMIFEEMDIDSKPNFSGFQTTAISETALARSRQIFQDKDTYKDTPMAEYYDSHNQEFGFKTGNKDKVIVSKESLAKSKQLFSEFDKNINIVDRNTKNINFKMNNNNKIIVNLDTIMNTQVMDNFEETLHTEDFLKEETPRKSKRSGSPILSCPKAKKRKIFQTPYSQKLVEEHVKEKPNFKTPKAVQEIEKVIFNPNYKKHKHYTLNDLKTIENSSKNKAEIDPYIRNFDFNNLLAFKFTGVRNDLNIHKEGNQKGALNIEDLKVTFLNSINKKLVPENWLDLHLKLILWKLFSYEISFPKTMSFICTAKSVIDQLKYRYDKELYNAERPALRKIMERDDTSVKTLCLCVVDIVYGEDGTIELLLSDGWYCIKTVIDKMLAEFVRSGKIAIGTKLMTQGSELVGNEQPVSPWEDTSTIRLKIFGNSTRRAHWSARLGYHGKAAILTQLSNVSQIGGKVAKLRVFVSRVYPALYVEKFDDGSTVTRSERLETIHQMKYENERQMLLEKLYEDVEKEIFDEDSQESVTSDSGNKRRCLDTGSQIAKMMKNSKNPVEFKETLTSTQHTLLNNYTALEREKLIQRLQERVREKIATSGLNVNRNVVRLLKIRLCDFGVKDDNVVISKAMLSIWKPNDAILEMLKEGTWIDILNVVPTSMRYSEIQLSAGRQSVFSLSKCKENEKITPYLLSLKRTCYLIKDLVKNPAITTDYNEIDTAGIVFQIDPAIKEFDSRKHQFQNVYLCDTEKNIICVNFWGGLKKFGFENVLDTGQIVAGVNLQKRVGNTRKNIPQYRVTEFSYFTKTPKNDTARFIIDDLSNNLTKTDSKQFIDECIALKNNYALKLQGSENISPYRFMNFDVNMSKNKIFLDSPLAQKNSKIEENLNLTGLDFESTFKQSDTQELSPKTLLRKKQVQQKIAKLKMYGEPPPLSPIQIINKSKNAGSAYKSPLISKSDVSPSVASENKHLPPWKESEEITCSPVISINRTFVKRNNVNPVKLNFSNNIKNESSISEIDEFAEDFDASPPLSLD